MCTRSPDREGDDLVSLEALMARIAVGPDTPIDQRPVSPPVPDYRCGVTTRYGRPCRQRTDYFPCKYHDADAYAAATAG